MEMIRSIREYNDEVPLVWMSEDKDFACTGYRVPYCVICEEARFGRGDPGHSPMVPGMEKAKWKW